MANRRVPSDITNAAAMASLNISTTQHRAPPQPVVASPTAAQPASPYTQQPPLSSQLQSRPAAEPLTAPLPTRANVAPPPVANAGVWSPEMGIRFGGLMPAPGNTQPGRGGPKQGGAGPGTWDPSSGVRFS